MISGHFLFDGFCAVIAAAGYFVSADSAASMRVWRDEAFRLQRLERQRLDEDLKTQFGPPPITLPTKTALVSTIKTESLRGTSLREIARKTGFSREFVRKLRSEASV